MSDQLDVSRLERKIENLASLTQETNNAVYQVSSAVQNVSGQLSKLAQSFEEMRRDAKKNAAIQKAATELVRVRQELEQEFGNYMVVRKTMLGVLQATDVALVRKNTISTVSEELMLSTPEYWLAPCLVAVAAWIGNDKDLADRAISEACRRNEEKTAITMALICRRNGRTQTCYEWLSLYFSKQNADHFAQSTFDYIDAYINGVFGKDEKHVCDDYISNWLSQITNGDAAFEQEQVDYWKNFCSEFENDMALREKYPDMCECVEEYNQIKNYVGRIDAVSSISDNFSYITGAVIDQEKLKRDIDARLIKMISRYDDKEVKLRRDEMYFTLVKENGEEDSAKQIVNSKFEAEKEKTISLARQMVDAIASDDKDKISQKKTAVSFMRPYIRKGFNEYIEENKTAFPSTITMKVDGWSGQTSDGSNMNALYADYEKFMNNQRDQAIAHATNSKSPMILLAVGAILAILGIIMGITGAGFGWVLAIAGVIAAISGFKKKKNAANASATLTKQYADAVTAGKNKLYQIAVQWSQAKTQVYNFNNEGAHEIIA